MTEIREVPSPFCGIGTDDLTIDVNGQQVKVLSNGCAVNTLAFECSCSRERIEKTLRSMGEEELYSILDEQGKIEVTCEFCSEMQLFNRQDVDTLLLAVH